MTTYRVDLASLADFVDRVGRFDAELLAAIEAAEGHVRRLHGTWDGAAAEGHREAHARWQRAAAEMRTGLGRMKRAAAVARTNYTGAGEANRRMWAI